MAGDVTSEFQEFWAQTAVKLRAYMFCSCENWTDADDMVQDCYLRALQGWGQFEGKASRQAWLYGIARRTCVDWFRRRKRDGLTVQIKSIDEPCQVEKAEPGTENVDKVWEAVKSLNSEQSQVIHLRFAAGLSYDQIAQALGVPVGTVRSRLHRGLESIRERVGRRENEM
jgi:RNA polymerase sigma-70 factor (ECF subfamily)